MKGIRIGSKITRTDNQDNKKEIIVTPSIFSEMEVRCGVVYEGIILTEEELLKFKEVKKTNDELLYISLPKICVEIHFVLFMESWIIEIHHKHSNLPIVLDTQYIHEVQNLYNALSTGGELTRVEE